MKFTDKYIANLKPTATRKLIYEENAHGQGSLGLRIAPTGRKAWVYTYSFAGRVRHMTLGVYPEMSVAQAHAAVGEAMRKRERGLDPAATTVELNTLSRQAPTFKDLSERYLEEWARPRKRSASEDERTLKRDVYPTFGAHKAEAVTRRDVRNLLDAIVRRGAPIQANRTLAVVRKVYNWGIGQDIVPHNPCQAIAAPGKETQRERFLTETEIATVLAKLPAAKMDPATRLALRLQLLTAQRCGEVLALEWSEIDEPAAVWTIPGAKAKNKRSHRVPLSAQALALLAEARAVGTGAFVFPSYRGDKPMVETAVARAVARNMEHFGVERFTPHDLRRTAASHMTGLGIPRLVVSKLLNHVESGVTAIYDRHSYDAEKRAALVQWGERVEALAQAKEA